MPRISAEARAATSYKAGGAPPPPPKHLTPEAAALWKKIVREKALGYFPDSAALALLSQFCETSVRGQKLAEVVAATDVNAPEAEELEKRLVKINGNLTTMATRLHLENETRLVSLTVKDAPHQTAAIMRALRAPGKPMGRSITRNGTNVRNGLPKANAASLVLFAARLAELIPPVAVGSEGISSCY
jgi:hypothetical protein